MWKRCEITVRRRERRQIVQSRELAAASGQVVAYLLFNLIAPIAQHVAFGLNALQAVEQLKDDLDASEIHAHVLGKTAYLAQAIDIGL